MPFLAYTSPEIAPSPDATVLPSRTLKDLKDHCFWRFAIRWSNLPFIKRADEIIDIINPAENSLFVRCLHYQSARPNLP
jgi:hypothetical protein